MASSNHKDTYLATSITMLVAGVIFLLDRWLGLASLGYGWLASKDNLLLFAALIFLIVKHDRSVGIVLLAIWVVLNIDLIVALLGHLSGYLLPLALIVFGLLLFYLYKR